MNNEIIAEVNDVKLTAEILEVIHRYQTEPEVWEYAVNDDLYEIMDLIAHLDEDDIGVTDRKRLDWLWFLFTLRNDLKKIFIKANK